MGTTDTIDHPLLTPGRSLSHFRPRLGSHQGLRPQDGCFHWSPWSAALLFHPEAHPNTMTSRRRFITLSGGASGGSGSGTSPQAASPAEIVTSGIGLLPDRRMAWLQSRLSPSQ